MVLTRQIWQRLQIPTPASARRISRDFFLIKSRSMVYLEIPTAALFGQGCLQPGMIKSTYGTGSSIMMNIGEKPILSTHGVVTSLAWKIGGKVNYVLEGNLNYTGAVITWLKDDLQLISSPGETGKLAKEAIQEDSTVSGSCIQWSWRALLGQRRARASVVGMSRTTRKAGVGKSGT